jgi:intracellular sulfur oxidation DsrE/DsrF family protein
MIKKLEKLKIFCYSCNKTLVYETYDSDILPKGWHQADSSIVNSNGFSYKINNDGYSYLGFGFTTNHICPDCFQIKDIIE